MQNKCKQCEKLNEEGSQFCDNCGNSFLGNSQPVQPVKTNGVNETGDVTPAEQATVMINKTKEKTEQTTKVAKEMWKKFSLPERIIVVGALLGIVSFFLPWITLVIDMEKTSGSGFEIAKDVWQLFLYPVAMLISLALIYFSQGASIKSKIKTARWQMVLGMFWLSIGIVGLLIIQPLVDMISNGINEIIQEMLSYLGNYTNSFSISASFSIGVWTLLLSAALIVIGAFKLQSVLLDKTKE